MYYKNLADLFFYHYNNNLINKDETVKLFAKSIHDICWQKYIERPFIPREMSNYVDYNVNYYLNSADFLLVPGVPKILHKEDFNHCNEYLEKVLSDMYKDEVKNNIAKAYNEELEENTNFNVFNNEPNIVKLIKNDIYGMRNDSDNINTATPIIINTHIIEKIKNVHHIDLNTLITVPDKILTPICVIQGSDSQSMVLILDLQDRHQDQILTAIKLDVDINNYKMNIITSTYGKEEFQEYFYRQVLNHNLLAINRDTIKKIVSLTTLRPALIALAGNQLTIYDNSIADNFDNVKTILNKNYENNLLQFETNSRFFRPVMKISNAELDLYLKENNKTSFDIRDTNEIENLATWKNDYNNQKINEYLYGGDGTRGGNGGAENTPNIVNENSTIDENINNNNDTTRQAQQQEQSQIDTIDKEFSDVDFSNVKFESVDNIKEELKQYLPTNNDTTKNNDKTNKNDNNKKYER